MSTRREQAKGVLLLSVPLVFCGLGWLAGGWWAVAFVVFGLASAIPLWVFGVAEFLR